jgi:hypothetical protein
MIFLQRYAIEKRAFMPFHRVVGTSVGLSGFASLSTFCVIYQFSLVTLATPFDISFPDSRHLLVESSKVQTLYDQTNHCACVK